MVGHFPKNRILEVCLNGYQVGILSKGYRGNLQFQYLESWLDLEGARPISLSLPLISQPSSGDVVYNFFDNLLPDNPEIKSRIQSLFSIKTNHPFDILEEIGKECIGAIQLKKTHEMPFEKNIRFKRVNTKEIAEILSEYLINPLGMHNGRQEFRISIAGVQEKTAFIQHENTWGIPLGSTPSTHIFKLPIGRIQHHNLDLRNSCENEWLCTQIAKAFKLPVAQNSIETFEGKKVLVVERFDRKLSNDARWLIRLPQEDFCQALGYPAHLKYQADGGPGIEAILKFLLGSSRAEKDRMVFYRAQILFWLLAAIDGHAKNFSLFIQPKGNFCLTPLYDILSAHPLIQTKQLDPRKIKMAMALKGKKNHYLWESVQRRHIISTAQKAGFEIALAEKTLDDMLAKVDCVVEKIYGILPKNFPKIVSDSILKGMKKTATALKLNGNL